MAKYLFIKYFLFWFIIVQSESIFQYMIPPKSDCWFITHDGQHLSNFAVESLNRLYIPLVLNQMSNIKDTYKNICRNFMFIYKSIGPVNSLFSNESQLIKDIESKNIYSDILVICENCRMIEIDSHVRDIAYKHLLNVIIVFIRNDYDVQNETLSYYLSNQTVFEMWGPAAFQQPYVITYKSIGGFKHLLNRLFDTQRNFIKTLTIFRISVFHCPPHIILENDTMDGVEYRIINEIFKRIKIPVQILKHKSSDDPWKKTKNDVLTGKSDMATCSVWLTEDTFNNFEITSILGSVCVTMLVPKPAPIKTISYLFLSLDITVWICFLVSIFTTTFFLNQLNSFYQR